MIFFISGFTGSGKTTIGMELAQLLKLEFIDLDGYIEREANQIISQIFEHKGEAEFRALEGRLLQKIILEYSTKDCVIALGGGTMADQENCRLILRSGIAIYIKRSDEYADQILEELIQTRPLFKGLSLKVAKARYFKLLAKREPFYMLSQLVTLANTDFSPKKLANTLKLLTNRPQPL